VTVGASKTGKLTELARAFVLRSNEDVDAVCRFKVRPIP
jgi:hypothetical protein